MSAAALFLQSVRARERLHMHLSQAKLRRGDVDDRAGLRRLVELNPAVVRGEPVTAVCPYNERRPPAACAEYSGQRG
jgi:hypothetical protein